MNGHGWESTLAARDSSPKRDADDSMVDGWGGSSVKKARRPEIGNYNGRPKSAMYWFKRGKCWTFFFS